MRLASLAVLALVSSVSLVGCGDSGGGIPISKEPAATTTTAADDDNGDSGSDGDRQAVIDYVVGVGEDNIDPEAGECVADAVLGELSADGVGTIRDSGEVDLTDYGSDDNDLLVGALDDCVGLDQALRAFSEGITSQADLPLSEDEAQCVSGGFAEEYTKAGEFIAAVSAMDDDEAGARFFEALGPCMTDESAVTFLAGILSSQGQDEATAQCVAESVVGSAGAETMLGWFSEASTSGDSSELEEALSRGLLDCGVDTGDGSAPVESIPSIGGGISGN